MKSFEKRKQEYFDKLTRVIEVVKNLASSEKGKEMARIMVDPKTEKDLEQAENTVDFLIILKDLKRNIKYGLVKKIKLENSLLCYMFFNLLKETLDDADEESIKAVFQELARNQETHARVMYEMIVVSQDPEQLQSLMVRLIQMVGIDIGNQRELLKLKLSLEKGMAKFQKMSFAPSDKKDSMGPSKEYVEYFRKAYEEGLKFKPLIRFRFRG